MNILEVFANNKAEVMALKKVSVLLCCTAAALAVCAAVFLNPGGLRQQGKAAPASSENSMLSYFTSNAASSQESGPAAPALASGSDVYLVKEYKGHIGVYRGNETAPFREYDMDVSVLPKADQAALKQGKVLHSLAEVEKLMEDYDG